MFTFKYHFSTFTKFYEIIDKVCKFYKMHACKTKYVYTKLQTCSILFLHFMKSCAVLKFYKFKFKLKIVNFYNGNAVADYHMLYIELQKFLQRGYGCY